jgi:hypothetical protein
MKQVKMLKAMPREDRKLQILSLFAKQIELGKVSELTQYDIAAHLNLSPGGHLLSILKEMVADGRLSFRMEEHRKNAMRTVFFLTPGTYKTPADYKREMKERKIEFKARGVSEQLSLFEYAT